jgi:hypothetical protein
VVMEELLAATHVIEPREDCPATAALPPATGFAALPLRLVEAYG